MKTFSPTRGSSSSNHYLQHSTCTDVWLISRGHHVEQPAEQLERGTSIIYERPPVFLGGFHVYITQLQPFPHPQKTKGPIKNFQRWSLYKHKQVGQIGQIDSKKTWGTKHLPAPKQFFGKNISPQTNRLSVFSGQMNFEIFRKTKKIGIPGKNVTFLVFRLVLQERGQAVSITHLFSAFFPAIRIAVGDHSPDISRCQASKWFQRIDKAQPLLGSCTFFRCRYCMTDFSRWTHFRACFQTRC